jgi:AraC-like DNA-binding protein
MRERASAADSLIARVRRHLRADSRDVSLRRVAADLGVAPRSLQRELAGAGSTFRGETRAARIEAAKEALAHSQDKLFAIAIDVGFASLQSFSDAFLEATGERPSAYRERLRPG